MLWATAIAATMLTSVGVLIWLSRREYRVIEHELGEIERLPEARAREIALQLLARPDLFSTRATSEPLLKTDLPASVREVLERFEEVALHEFWIGRAALSQPARYADFAKIGEDSEFEQILVRPGDVRIHRSFHDVRSDDEIETVPSLWHHLIIVSGVNLHDVTLPSVP